MGKYLDIVRALEETPTPLPNKPNKPPRENSRDSFLGSLGTVPMTFRRLDHHSERVIRDWLTRIEETDSEVINEVLHRAEVSIEARIYFLRRAIDVQQHCLDKRIPGSRQ